MRIALFKNVELDYQSILKQSSYEDDSACMPGYVRLSEWVDVEFNMLPDDVVARAEIEVLDSILAPVVSVDKFTQRRDELAKSLPEFPWPPGTKPNTLGANKMAETTETKTNADVGGQNETADVIPADYQNHKEIA